MSAVYMGPARVTTRPGRQFFVLLAVAAILSFGVRPGFAEEANPRSLPMTGFNLAGAEFGKLPGQPGQDYFYPSQADVTELLLRGANVFRLPFLWERLQPKLGEPFDPAEVARLKAAVDLMTAEGAKVIISPHNYARYDGHVIGSPAVPITAFARFWRELAPLFRDNSLIIFGLMNEPHDMPTALWRDAANAAIKAIRTSGASNMILVPGNAWTGGQSWSSPDYGVSNAVMMGAISDPLDNYVYEIHQYMDADYSGTHAECQSTDVGEQALKGVTDWLTRRGQRAFLAEFGSTTNTICLQAMDSMLYFVEEHPKAWLGWTYWAAGSWWGANPLSAQPRNGVDPPQLLTLMNHIRQP